MPAIHVVVKSEGVIMDYKVFASNMTSSSDYNLLDDSFLK